MSKRRRYNSYHLVDIPTDLIQLLRKRKIELGYTNVYLSNLISPDKLGQRPTDRCISSILTGRIKRTSKIILTELQRVLLTKPLKEEVLIVQTIDDELFDLLFCKVKEEDKIIILTLLKRLYDR